MYMRKELNHAREYKRSLYIIKEYEEDEGEQSAGYQHYDDCSASTSSILYTNIKQTAIPL